MQIKRFLHFLVTREGTDIIAAPRHFPSMDRHLGGKPGDETAGGVGSATGGDAPGDKRHILPPIDVERRGAPVASRLGRFFFHGDDPPLGVNLSEGGGATAENTKVTIEPDTVSLAGDSKLLAGINKINLASIDLTDFTTSFSDTYVIPIDNELRNVTGATEAKVTVEIVGLETKNVKVTNISCINVTEGYAAEILTRSLDVTLRGSPESIAMLKDENIRAVADLTDMNSSVGTYMPRVRIYVDGYTDVGSIKTGGTDYSIYVQIEKAAEKGPERELENE